MGKMMEAVFGKYNLLCAMLLFFFPLCYQTLSPLITSEAKESLANSFKPKFSVLFQIGVTLFFSA